MTGFIFEKFGAHFCPELYPEKTVWVPLFLDQFHPPDGETGNRDTEQHMPLIQS